MNRSPVSTTYVIKKVDIGVIVWFWVILHRNGKPSRHGCTVMMCHCECNRGDPFDEDGGIIATSSGNGEFFALHTVIGVPRNAKRKMNQEISAKQNHHVFVGSVCPPLSPDLHALSKPRLPLIDCPFVQPMTTGRGEYEIRPESVETDRWGSLHALA